MAKIIEDGKGPGFTMILVGIAVAAGALAFFMRSSEAPVTERSTVTEIASGDFSGQQKTVIRTTTVKRLPDGSYVTGTGLKYSDIREAKGKVPPPLSEVEVHYTGTRNGVKFDSSYDRGQPFKFRLGVGQVIKGWDEGLADMPVGSMRHLTIPPELAYGERGAGDIIPPNATLDFDVEMLGFTPPNSDETADPAGRMQLVP